MKPIPGYYKQGDRYLKCAMVDGPYKWKNAVKLRDENGDFIVNGADFVTQKPESERSRLAKAKREAAAIQRKIYCADLIKRIGTGIFLGDLHDFSAAWLRIRYFDELRCVRHEYRKPRNRVWLWVEEKK